MFSLTSIFKIAFGYLSFQMCLRVSRIQKQTKIFMRFECGPRICLGRITALVFCFDVECEMSFHLFRSPFLFFFKYVCGFQSTDLISVVKFIPKNCILFDVLVK